MSFSMTGSAWENDIFKLRIIIPADNFEEIQSVEDEFYTTEIDWESVTDESVTDESVTDE